MNLNEFERLVATARLDQPPSVDVRMRVNASLLAARNASLAAPARPWLILAGASMIAATLAATLTWPLAQTSATENDSDMLAAMFEAPQIELP